MKWISRSIYTGDVEEFLNYYEFESSTLTITHIDNWKVLVTLYAKSKKEQL